MIVVTQETILAFIRKMDQLPDEEADAIFGGIAELEGDTAKEEAVAAILYQHLLAIGPTPTA